MATLPTAGPDTTTPAVILKFDQNVMHHGGLGAIRSLAAGAQVEVLSEPSWDAFLRDLAPSLNPMNNAEQHDPLRAALNPFGPRSSKYSFRSVPDLDRRDATVEALFFLPVRFSHLDGLGGGRIGLLAVEPP